MEIKKSSTFARVQPRAAHVVLVQPWTDTQVDLPGAHGSRCRGTISATGGENPAPWPQFLVN